MSYSLGDAHAEQWQEEKDNLWNMAEDARRHLCEVNPSDKFAQAVYHFYLVARLQHLESKENSEGWSDDDEDNFEWFQREMQRFGDDGKFIYTCKSPHDDFGIEIGEDLESLDDTDKEEFLQELKLFEQYSLSDYDDGNGKSCVMQDTIHEGQFQEIIRCCIHCGYSEERGW